MIANYLFQILIGALASILVSIGLIKTTETVFPMAEPSFMETTAEKAFAEQVGGDKVIIAPLYPQGFKTLPLALKRQQKQPVRRPDSADFEVKKITSQTAYMMDAETETALFDFLGGDARPIGSITKLMTALVFLDNNPQWEKIVQIEAGDGVEGRLHVFEGDKIIVKDLSRVFLISSSNNATMALARSSGLSLEEFVRQMNKKAEQLGLYKTKFVEPTGLNAGNQSTARETALLLKQALSNKFITEVAAKKDYVFTPVGSNQPRRIISTNLLLSEKMPLGNIAKIVGGKTGFVEEAGYCFAIMVEDAAGHLIIAVVLGSDSHFSRFSEAQALADWAFEAYEWPD